MIHELVLHTSKSHQNIVGTQANYESTKYSNEKSKSNKVLRTTAKMMHELLPDRKKVMETLRARRMIRLLPERYDLNRPLVHHSLTTRIRIKHIKHLSQIPEYCRHLQKPGSFFCLNSRNSLLFLHHFGGS